MQRDRLWIGLPSTGADAAVDRPPVDHAAVDHAARLAACAGAPAAALSSDTMVIR
jgi:hypothetical protein